MIGAARNVSGAMYAALGVLDQSRTGLERFMTAGVDEGTRRIGVLPRGRGVLGELITNPVPLRVAELGAHPDPCGFPAEHPPMGVFLGVSVMVSGEPFANLYLTEKLGGAEFSAHEEAVELLAEFVGVAIDHARRCTGLESRHCELRRTVDALDAPMQFARAGGGEIDLGVILGLVAKRGRDLVSGRTPVIENER